MNVKTATRILDLFEAFATEARPLSLSELGRVLAIPVSSCFALVRTLENRGYVYESSRRGGYYPTKRLLAIAERIAGGDSLLERINPLLMQLRDDSRESVVFGKLQAGKVVYLDMVESPQRIRYTAGIGEFRPLHANSVAKAILGAMEPGEREEILAACDWTRYTDATLVTPAELEADLALSRQRGWYGNLSESVTDLAAVSWPVKLNREWYGISIAGPIHRMQPLLAQHGALVRAACEAAAQAG
ncbi:MAG: iclR 8 [Paucimonas sp.]|nr:iclR 8 [Paucimonas sp.]